MPETKSISVPRWPNAELDTHPIEATRLKKKRETACPPEIKLIASLRNCAHGNMLTAHRFAPPIPLDICLSKT